MPRAAGLRASIKPYIWRVFVALVRPLPPRLLERLVPRVVHARADSLPPPEALRLLFRIDSALYPAHGVHAVAYGDGTHAKHRHTRYHDFFTERIGAGERVLDVGCGIGALAHSIASRSGAAVVGIDIEPPKVEQARADYPHPNVDYVVGDATEQVPGGSFDVVVLSNVLEHLTDRSRFLRTVLDNVGARRALIRVPLFERDWRVPLKRELGVEWRLDPTHEIEYTPLGFRAELKDAGLEITEEQLRWGEIWAEARRSAPPDDDA